MTLCHMPILIEPRCEIVTQCGDFDEGEGLGFVAELNHKSWTAWIIKDRKGNQGAVSGLKWFHQDFR